MFTLEEIETDPILRFFRFDHLPAKVQIVSRTFAEIAQFVITICPHNAERSVALRKLLEAKDAAVRAALPATP
jgi:hypothetical protein